MNKIAFESCEVFNATDVIPCEPVGAEDRLGAAYVGDDLAAKSVRLFNKTALDRILSHDDIYDILGSRRRLRREEITERETEQRVGSADFSEECVTMKGSHVLRDACLVIVH